MLNVAGEGTAAGALKVTLNPVPLIVPNVALPLVTPFTVQVTAVLLVPITVAVSPRLACAATLAVGLEGMVMETSTPATIVKLTEADLLGSAMLVAVTLNVAGEGTAAGAV
jgi:hypothetical protein